MLNAPGTVRLVRMNEAHLASTLTWLSESERLRRQIDSMSAPTAAGNVAYWQANWSNRTRRDFAIVDRETHVGNCGLCNIDEVRKKCELWIYLGGGYGGGSGTQAVELLLAHSFRELQLNRTYLRVVSDNPRALTFYKRIGFVEEGRFRQDTRHGDTYVDSIWLAILASEYFARPARALGA